MLAQRAVVAAAAGRPRRMTAISAARPPDGSGRPCYLLPLRRAADQDLTDLTAYLRQISAQIDVLVVDGSPDDAFAGHQRAWSKFAGHIRPQPDLRYLNGKVNAVITGVRHASADRIVIADDDVRYELPTLTRLVALLDHADVVMPQNYFDPLPWHAAWDSARSLINRAFGMDYAGTLAVRRGAFLAAGCYDGDVLFENLELIRTMRAAGATVISAPHVLVRRLPPQTGHFARQRLRQAYDSLAQPPRLAAELALAPAAAYAAARHRRWLGIAVLAAVGLAESGRRRHGGHAAFRARCSWFAPFWLAERSACSWLALACRLRGGVRYAGQRLRRSANPPATLRRRVAARSLVAGPEAGTRVRAVAERLER
jgi:Glycosyl transferase family 2